MAMSRPRSTSKQSDAFIHSLPLLRMSVNVFGNDDDWNSLKNKLDEKKRANAVPVVIPSVISKAVSPKKSKAIISRANSSLSLDSGSISAKPKRVLSATVDSIFEEDEWEKYFGDNCKRDLYDIYHKECARRGDSDGNTSPRSVYASKLKTDQTLPYPIILRKRENPKSINLPFRGLGDKPVAALGSSLPFLKHVQDLNIRDNRLTDNSLIPLLSSLSNLPSLISLDLSQNKIDDASRILRSYLSQASCKLERLVLCKSDVDDGECVDLMEALQLNSSLKYLDLSCNSIGMQEAMNIVNPDFQTGGESIGNMLMVNNTIEYLDLSWNYIRLASASTIADAIGTNKSLKTLIVRNNGFGNIPTQRLAVSIGLNTSLETLDLSFNTITPTATIVFAYCLQKNLSLLHVHLDGNILGKRGAESLMSAMRRSQRLDRFLEISIANSDVDQEDSSLFNPMDPNGHFELNMSDPYSIIIVTQLLSFMKSRVGWEFSNMSVRENNTASWKSLKLDKIVESNANELSAYSFQNELAGLCKRLTSLLIDIQQSVASYIDTEGDIHVRFVKDLVVQILVLCNLAISEQIIIRAVDYLTMLATNTHSHVKFDNEENEWMIKLVMLSLFKGLDRTRSGQVDIKSIEQFSVKLHHSLVKHDVSRDGKTDEEEFLTATLSDFVHCMYRQETAADAGMARVNIENTEEEWKIPDSGFLKFDYAADFCGASESDLDSNEGVNGIITNMKRAASEKERTMIFDKSANNSDLFLTAEQAQLLLDDCKYLPGAKMKRISNILPQILYAGDCAKVLESNLNLREKLLLRWRLGNVFNLFVGNATGHYLIDLSSDSDRAAARKLCEVNNGDKRFGKLFSNRSDTSQKGNWENYRNDTFNRKPIVLTSKWLTNLASVGKLRLDYVSTAVAKRSVQAMGPIKFDSFIQSLNFDSARLQVNRLMSISSSPLQTPVILSRESSHAEEGEDDESEVDANFNQELASATIEIITSLVPEKKRYSPKKKISNLISAFDDFYGLELAIPQFITNHWISTQWQEWRETCHLELNYLGEEKMRDSSSQSNVKEANKNSPIAIQRQSTSSSAMNQSNDFCLVNADYDADDCTLPMVGQSIDLVFVIWFMKIIEIQVTAYHKPLSCEQVKEVMLQFPSYGFLRVQCLITLFGRIVNFESFDRVILNGLRPIEQREIFHRIGCLNMLNPYYPERMYEFDLRSWEDREYVKILVKLAVEEVGENWTDEEYRWSKYDEPVAGWKLPESWAVEENDSRNKNSDVGPRRYGRLKFCYSKGCSPSVSVRKSLMNRVLCGSVRPL